MSNWAWVDVETTGVDLVKDEILEIAVVVTTSKLVEIDAFEALIRHNSLPELNPFVLDMHTRNGLWAAISEHGKLLKEVEESLGNFLSDNLGGLKHLVLAGSGVSHFDSKFINKFFPEASKLLTFWTNDAAVLKRGYEAAGFKTGKKGRKDTRGLDECRKHIEEWKYYVSKFKEIE